MSSTTWKGDAWLAKATVAINAGLTEVARVMAEKAVTNFGRDGSPSVPSGVPGIVHGYLRDSIAYVSPEALGTPLRSAWGTAVMYGRYLEFGTHRDVGYAKGFGGRMHIAARPWVLRATYEAMPEAVAAGQKKTEQVAKQLGIVT